MGDVTDDKAVIDKPVVNEPTAPSAVGGKGKSETPAPVAEVSEAIPNPELENYKKALQQEREQRKAFQKELAGFKSAKEQSRYNPDEYSQWAASPYSQELLIKVAKQELTDFARETLADSRYSNLNSQVKKAILSNVRGFVNEATTDVETAKVDLLDYIERILQDEQSNQTAPRTPTIPVAPLNGGVSESVTTPAEIKSILEKSPLDWTEDEANILEAYHKSQGKKSKK